jgi:hypothetical protein
VVVAVLVTTLLRQVPPTAAALDAEPAATGRQPIEAAAGRELQTVAS